jgi:NAD(P)-dependent dehydrogenase (short-subunit alcohol dehydrogenase family)
MQLDHNPEEKMAPNPKRAVILGGFSLLTILGLAYVVGTITAQGRAEAKAAEASDMRSSIAGDQQVILITGSTDGLGREVALQLASTGAHIIVHGRNRERGMEVVREIEEEGTGSARFYAADLGSLQQVRDLARTIQRDYDRLDVLVNNAGIGSGATQGGRVESADGHELTFAVNYLSGFLLTRMLLPMIVESAPARIVNVASAAQTPIDFDDVMLEREGAISRAYGQSKLAQILFTFDLAEELEGTGVLVNSLHPATFMATNMVISAGVQPRSTVEEGAEAVLNLVTNPDIGSGGYFNGLRQMRAHDQAYDREARDRLRTLSLELTGLD